MANSTNSTSPTTPPTATATSSSTTTSVLSPTPILTATSTTVGPETILPVILVVIAVVIALVFALLIFRRRQIRRKKLYAIQLAMTNRRIQAIGMLKQKAENELASWPRTQPKQQRQATIPGPTEHPTVTLRSNMMSSSVSSLHSEPPYFNHMLHRNVAEPNRCRSANALIMSSHTVDPCRVYTLDVLANSKKLAPPRRGSASDVSVPNQHAVSRVLGGTQFASQRVSDKPQSHTVVAEVYDRRPISRSSHIPLRDGDLQSVSHTATYGSNSAHAAESSNFDSYYPSSSYDSPGWPDVDFKKARKAAKEQWAGTPLASEGSTMAISPHTCTPSQVTSQSEKWV